MTLYFCWQYNNIAHFTIRESTKFTIYRIFIVFSCPCQQKVHDFWILPNCLSADPGVEVLLRVLFRLGVWYSPACSFSEEKSQNIELRRFAHFGLTCTPLRSSASYKIFDGLLFGANSYQRSMYVNLWYFEHNFPIRLLTDDDVRIHFSWPGSLSFRGRMSEYILFYLVPSLSVGGYVRIHFSWPGPLSFRGRIRQNTF